LANPKVTVGVVVLYFSEFAGLLKVEDALTTAYQVSDNIPLACTKPFSRSEYSGTRTSACEPALFAAAW